MLYSVMTAGFQDIVKTYKVGFNINIQIGNQIPHTRLSSQIHDNRRLILSKQIVNESLIRDTTLDENPILTKGLYLFEPIVFDIHIIIIGD